MIVKKCKNCDVEFKIRPYRKDTAKYCSRKCFNETKIGKPSWNKGKKGWTNSGSFKGGRKHWNWNDGVSHTGQGYIRILKKRHPGNDYYGYVLRSHLVAEKYLGRYLDLAEVIHHINEIKDDDRIENLYLFPSTSGHTKFHRAGADPTLKSNLL